MLHLTAQNTEIRRSFYVFAGAPVPGMQRPGRETSHSSPTSSAVRMDVPIPLPAHFRVYTQLLVVNLKEFAGQPISPII